MTESIVPAPDEHLTTGWEPDTPATDTLVRSALLAHASWPVHVAAALGHPHRTTDRWAAGRIADRGALSNPALLLQPLTDPTGVLDELAAVFPPPVPFVLLSPWPTPDLTDRGLVLLGHPPLMVRLPAAAQPPQPPGVDVVEVDDEKRLAVAERVLVEGYPMPDLQPLDAGDLLAPALLSPVTRVWVGYVDGEPAATAVAHLGAAATLVEYVATLPVARGRGAGAAVTWAATLADPARPAVLLASDDGRPVYERMGYFAVERWTAWLRPGADERERAAPA